jgi:hypothetical protein
LDAHNLVAMQPPTWKCKIEKCHRSDVPAVPK